MRQTTAHRLRRGSTAFALLAALGIAACQTSERQTTGQPAPGEGMVLSDAEVANITNRANSAEIQAAQLALQKSQNNSVRQFAQRMITDHTALMQRINAIEGDLRGPSTATPLTQQLDATNRQTLQTLQQLQGAQFDRTYMQNQVQQHQWLLNTLDNALIPSARNNTLERDLREAREIVAAHLQHAQQVHGSLNQ